MTDRELLTQALEALENTARVFEDPSDLLATDVDLVLFAITALRERLAREEQEPWVEIACPLCGEMAIPAPQPAVREWQGLTGDDLMALPGFNYEEAQFIAEREFARAIEAKLREKNA